MEKSQRIIDSANKSFGEIIREGFRLFSKNYVNLIIPLAVFQIILIVLDIFALTDLRWYADSLGVDVAEIMEKLLDNITLTESEFNSLTKFLLITVAIGFIQNLIGAIVITIAMCSVSNYLFNRYMQNETNIRDSFKSAFNKKIFLVILLIGVCLPLSVFMLFIPAIIIFGFFIFLVFTYNMNDVQKPISEARRIAKGNFWKILITFVLNFIIIFIVRSIYLSVFDLFLNPSSDLYNSWLSPDTRNYVMIILYQILRNLIDILLAPLFICLLTSLFASSKAKKDLGYEYQGRYQSEGTVFLPSPRTSNIIIPEKQSDNQNVEKFYCPFCGYEIHIPKKFCPNCGESFIFLNE
ncbi:MAG: hypothetical protein ACFFA3_17700 [Promethearchaeota archaeon]